MPERRKFSREVKLAAVERLLAGESVAALARELGVVHKLLHHWRAKYLAGGAEAWPSSQRSRGRAASRTS